MIDQEKYLAVFTEEEWHAWLDSLFMYTGWDPLGPILDCLGASYCPICKVYITRKRLFIDWETTCEKCGFTRVFSCMDFFISMRLYRAWLKLERNGVVL